MNDCTKLILKGEKEEERARKKPEIVNNKKKTRRRKAKVHKARRRVGASKNFSGQRIQAKYAEHWLRVHSL